MESAEAKVEAARNGDTKVFLEEMIRLTTARLALEEGGKKDKGKGRGVLALDGWGEDEPLHPYADALRDSLISYFELNNLTHQPKLVGITSCKEGAGVSTIATGLAASLSETGEGNVLLVDMDQPDAAAHPFHLGRPACGLMDVLDLQSRDQGLVQDKLYVAAAAVGERNLPNVAPKRLAHWMPKLKGSDYDYIIFDMPAVSQISVTPRLAGMMDVVLVVVEAEKDNRDVVTRVCKTLRETKANLGVVLNKTRRHVPRELEPSI